MSKEKILVVDDEENIRGSLKGILSDEGYDVALAEDGETALRMIRSDTPDLVLLDIWIPGIDGIQTLEILKKMDADLEVVMMSGHGAIDTAVKATKMGAFDFIEKPFSLDTILKSVSQALDNKKRSLPKEAPGRVASMASWFAGPSDASLAIRSFIEKASASDKPTLIYGEQGIGRSFASELIHDKSAKNTSSFISVPCDYLNDNNFEKLVFGIIKSNGVLKRRRKSQFEKAKNGTIYFHQLDKLSVKCQRKLWKVFTNRSFTTPTRQKPITFNARIMASADEQALDQGKGGLIMELIEYFSDLTHRLVPLRERKEDIPEIVSGFVSNICSEYDKHVDCVDSDLVEALAKAPWRGNTADLFNVIEPAVLACDGRRLSGEHLTLSDTTSRDGPEDTGKVAIVKNGRNIEPHRTLKKSVVLCGHGLHSGLKTGIILSPLPPGSGIVFWDISSGGRVSAKLSNVRSTEYATTLSNGEVVIKTVEHIMSALHSYKITNLLVKIGDEAPIMDGSAIDFCQIIEDGGVEEQNDYLEQIIIDEPITVGDLEEGRFITVEPADQFSINYHLNYPAPIGEQDHEYIYESGSKYRDTIAPARTFGFLKDMKKLEEAGLAIGGKLSNVILIDNEKIVNTPLRFPNEPARHKILDLIGDLYLLGRPIKGKFTASESGHSLNIALVKKIEEHINH